MRPCKLFPYSRFELDELMGRTQCGRDKVDELLKDYRD